MLNRFEFFFCLSRSSEEGSLSEAEQVQLTRFCFQYANNLLPYLQRCLDIFCPSTALSKTLGISQLELNKLRAHEGISFTKLNTVAHGLEDMLPAQVVEFEFKQPEELKQEGESVVGSHEELSLMPDRDAEKKFSP